MIGIGALIRNIKMNFKFIYRTKLFSLFLLINLYFLGAYENLSAQTFDKSQDNYSSGFGMSLGIEI